MDKWKKTGIILAALLFVFATAARYVPGDATEDTVLPILAIVCTILCVIHIAALKSHKDRNVAATDIVRAITLGVTALVLGAATVLNFIT